MPSRQDKPLVDIIYESYYGESPVVLQKQLKTSKKAEEQARLAEEQARALLEKSIQLLAKNLAWDAEKIAKQLEIEVSLVKQILGGSTN